MFIGAHIIVYSKNAEADRAFLRDHLGFAGVDAGDGWLIFKLPPAEIAIHPTDGDARQELYFLCDDIGGALGKLRVAGAELTGAVSDEGWGMLAQTRLPSGSGLSLYEPRHPVAFHLGEGAKPPERDR